MLWPETKILLKNGQEAVLRSPVAEDAAKVHGMWNWFSPSESEHEVPDPYYGGPAGFDAVVALLARAMENLLRDARLPFNRDRQ